MVGVKEFNGFGKAKVGLGGEEDRQGELEFEPREGGADAEVQPAAEGRVSTDRAGGIEAVGIGPDRGVAVGGAEEELHAVALGEAVAVDLDLFERDAGEDVEGRIVAEDFLDHAGAFRG